MPTQRPLIDLDKLDRDRAAQLRAVQQLANRMPSGVASDGYNVSAATLARMFWVFDDLTSKKCPENWQGIEHWTTIAGWKSEKTTRRAIEVLRSMGLIVAEVRFVGPLMRRMVVSINWSTVFSDEPIEQDEEDLRLWTARKKRQRQLFCRNGNHYRSETDMVTTSKRTPLPVLPICNPQTDPPIHPQGGGQGGESVSSRAEEEFTTETRRHGDGEPDEALCMSSVMGTRKTSEMERPASPGPSAMRLYQVSRSEKSTAAPEQAPAGIPTSQPSVPPCLRGEFNDADRAVRGDHLAMVSGLHSSKNQEPGTKNDSGPSTLNPQPSTPSMLRTIQPGEPELIRHLTRLGSTGAAAVIKSSLGIGYSTQHIREILEHWEATAIEVDGPNGQKKLVRPHTISQLCQRLRDPNAIPGEGIGPQHGRWGPIDGLYTLATRQLQIAEQKALEAVLQAPEPKQAPPVGQKVEIPPYTKPEILALAQQHPPDRLVQASIDKWTDGPCPKYVGLWAVRVGRETRG